MAERHELLLDENLALKKALSSTKSLLERSTNDGETLRKLHDELKQQYQRIQKESDRTSQNLIQCEMEKREIENQFNLTIRSLKFGIEQKQREIEEIQAKMMPNLEIDMLKIKIINELEIPHKTQLEEKQIEIDKLIEENYDLRRNLELLDAKFENYKAEKEKDLKMITDRLKGDLNMAHQELNNLHDRLQDNRDKEIIRVLKKENDELKTRLNAKDQEIEESSNELLKSKQDKHDILIKFNKQLDTEKTEKHFLKSQVDKLTIRTQCLEEEIKKLQTLKEYKMQELDNIEKASFSFQSQLQSKDDTIYSLQKKLNEKEEIIISDFRKYQDELNKQKSEEQDKLILERNKLTSFQKQIKNLQNEIELLNETKTVQVEKLNKELESVKKEKKELEEDNRDLKKQGIDSAKHITFLQKDCAIKEEEVKQMEKESKHWRNKSINGPPPRSSDYPKESPLLATKKLHNEKIFHDPASNISSTKLNKLQDKLSKANQKIMDLLKDKAGLAKELKEFKELKEKKIPICKTEYYPEKRGVLGGLNYSDDVLVNEIRKNIGQGPSYYNSGF